MPDKISDLPVFGGTIYSPELFSNPNKNVESDDTTLCDNISNTLIASGNENDTCTSGSQEVDITDNEHETFLHIMYHVMMTSLSFLMTSLSFLMTVRVTVQSVS